jgi:hypothetical protein
MAYKIFISHAQRDGDIARDLAHRLEGAAVRAFLSGEGVQAGEATAIKLDRRLHDSDEVIVLLTEHALKDPAVLFEMGAAFGSHKPVTPIVVGVSREELPSMVRDLRYISYASVSDYIAELRKRVGNQGRS